MGATKELHAQMREQEMSERQEMVQRFIDKKIRLSYSTLKNFTSPINIINYKLKKFIPNPSMIFGKLCDVLLLTPQNFNKEFKIVGNTPTTDKQTCFCDEIAQKGSELSEEEIKAVFSNHYSRGDAMKTYTPLKDYIDGKILGLELVTQDIYDEAVSLVENLKSQPDIEEIFKQISEVQKKVEWHDSDWDFVGYLDILVGEDHIYDVKFSKDANPEKFERDIANFDYFLQAAMYCYALKEMGVTEMPKFSFIVFDKSYNYSIIHLDYSYLMYGFKKYKYLLQELNKAAKYKAFNKSYGFFRNEYNIGKPNWAKGFLLDEDFDSFFTKY